MTASSNSSGADWPSPAADRHENDRAKKMKLRLLVIGVVGACAALAVIAALNNMLGH